jgi:hypothetical protein
MSVRIWHSAQRTAIKSKCCYKVPGHNNTFTWKFSFSLCQIITALSECYNQTWYHSEVSKETLDRDRSVSSVDMKEKLDINTQRNMLHRDSTQRNLRSKFQRLTRYCSSHEVSHFAALFIGGRAKSSIAESYQLLSFSLRYIITRLSQHTAPWKLSRVFHRGSVAILVIIAHTTVKITRDSHGTQCSELWFFTAVTVVYTKL